MVKPNQKFIQIKQFIPVRVESSDVSAENLSLSLDIHTDCISYNFMFRQNMFLKINPVCKRIFTLIIRILDAFMFRLNMGLESVLSGGLITAMTTEILQSLMFRVNMSLKMAPI